MNHERSEKGISAHELFLLSQRELMILVSRPKDEIVCALSKHNFHLVLEFANNYMPILRPISDLEKGFEYKRSEIVQLESFKEYEGYSELKEFLEEKKLSGEVARPLSEARIPYYLLRKLASYNLDVFGFLQNGLAVSYSEIDGLIKKKK